MDENTKNAKSVYETPRLIRHGSLESLTRSGNGSGTDGGTAGMQMVM